MTARKWKTARRKLMRNMRASTWPGVVAEVRCRSNERFERLRRLGVFD